MSSISVCNHTNDKQIGLPRAVVRFWYHSYDYRLNWTPPWHSYYHTYAFVSNTGSLNNCYL